MLQPLENAVSDHQRQAISLNIEYKMSILEELKEDTTKLQGRAQSAVDDMNKVGDEIGEVTGDMREIVDGLASGLSPQQIELSVETGRQWLEEIKQYNFDEERRVSLEEQQAARDLREKVREFSDPVKKFQEKVSDVQKDIGDVDNRLQDLEDNLEKTEGMIRTASSLNFRNSDPPASFKTGRIATLDDNAKSSNDLGSSLVFEADKFLRSARDSYGRLTGERDNMQAKKEDFNRQISDQLNAVIQNDARLNEAEEHVIELEGQAGEFGSILTGAKEPAARSLQAAQAYDNIAKAMAEAEERAEEARNDAEEAESISYGVSDKATQSEARTRSLYDEAVAASDTLRTDLDPRIESAKNDVKQVEAKTKVTKQAVEAITRGMDNLKEVTDVLKDTMQKADDAETLAHDALQSIDARADLITRNMAGAKKIQDDSADLKFALEATKKALEEIEARRRQKRKMRREKREDEVDDEELEAEMDNKVDKLKEKERVLDGLSESVSSMMARIKSVVAKVRGKLKKMDVGVEFEGESNLELKNPENLEEMAVKTEVSMYFNVTDRESDDRAFLMYMGNEEGTHTMMPHTSTDDFMAVELVEGGRLKVTIDLGAGVSEVYSGKPVKYGQWNRLEIERNGYQVTVTISSEEGPGEVTRDSVTDYLRAYDEHGRPFGSVFNLHPDYSKIYVGGFPTSAKIQDEVRETFMYGQVSVLS